MSHQQSFSSEAQWIWAQNVPRTEHCFVCFRRRFSIDRLPQHAIIRIAADREYTLSINGRTLARGSLSTTLFKRFDEVDISTALQEGENLVAVLVYAEANRFHLTQGPAARGLLCEIICDDKIVAVSNVTWKAQFRSAWLFPVSHFDDTTYAEFFDARKESASWDDPSSAEDEWPSASACFPEIHGLWGAPIPHSRYYPWINLLRNEISQLATRQVSPVAVHRGEVRQTRQASAADTAVRMSLEEFLPLQKTKIEDQEDGSILLVNSDPRESWREFDGVRNVSLVCDFGRILNGRLAFSVNGAGSSRIDIGYGTSLEGGRVVPYRSQRTPQADHYILREGAQQWQTYQWRQFRYVQLTFRDLDKPLSLSDLSVEETFHDFEYEGEFSSDHHLLDQSVEMCRRALFVSVLDRSMDNASRERRQYLGDCSAVVPAILHLHGGAPFLVKYFRQFSEAQHQTGLYPYSQPGMEKDEASLFDHALTFPIQLRNYLLHSGNLSLATELWEGLLRFWRLIDSCRRDDGLMEWPPYAVWFDWADIDRGNDLFLLNGLTCLAIESIVGIGQMISASSSVMAEMEAAAKALRIHLSEKWFDPDQGVIADRILPDGLSRAAGENTNSLAILGGFAKPDQVPQIMERLASGKMACCSPGWWGMPAAFIRANRTDLALEWLSQRVGPLLAAGRETWPETWCLYGENTRGVWRCRDSRAEAQAAGLGPLLAAYSEIAGLRPLEAGMKVILFAPRPGPLRQFRMRTPSPAGWIEAEYRAERGTPIYRLTLPSGISAVVRLPLELDASDFQCSQGALAGQFAVDEWGVKIVKFRVEGEGDFVFRGKV